MSSGGDSEVFTSHRRSRPSPSKSLPQMFVEKEVMSGLRHRHSSSSTPDSSPPLITSTPDVNLGYLRQQFLRQQFHTPAKARTRSLSVNIDSGYGGVDTTRKKFDSNPDGSYISSPLRDLAELVTSPVRDLRRRWRGRQSFLEPGQTRLGGGAGKLVRQVEPHQVLAWLMVSVVLTSLGFALLVSLRQDRGNNKYRSIQFGNDKLSERIRNEGKLEESVIDVDGISLGGEGADIPVVVDKLAGGDSLDQEVATFEQVQDFNNDFDEIFMKVQENTNLKPDKDVNISTETLSKSKEPDFRKTFPDEDTKMKRKMEIKSKLKSFRPPSAVPGLAPHPRTGNVLFKVKDASTDPELEVKNGSTDSKSEVKDANTDPRSEMKDEDTDHRNEAKDASTYSKEESPSPPVAVGDISNVTNPELEDSSASDTVEDNTEEGDVLPSAVAEQKVNLETSPAELKGETPLETEPKAASRRRTKLRNPLLKQSYKMKMSKVKKSKKALLKAGITSADDANDHSLMNSKDEYQGTEVKEVPHKEEIQRKKAPVLKFPDDATFRKRNTQEVDKSGEE